MLADIHAHIHVKEFDDDREKVIQRAFDAGVQKIINVGFDVEGNFRALALAKKYDFIFATFGIHPHLASEWNDEVGANMLALAAREPKVVALGEMGLDFYKNFQPKEVQQKAFEGQLTLAKELDLPVIIHCRGAFPEIFSLLKKHKMKRVLLHCFTGTRDVAEEAWRRGYVTSFTGILTYPNAKDLQNIFVDAPLERIFFETDSPFLAPQKYRGSRNEPAYVGEIYAAAARLKGIKMEDLEQQVEENLQEFFKI